MTPLNKKEIYDELKKLGINTAPELKSCLREYYTYSVEAKINTYSPGELTAGVKDNQPDESKLLNRPSPTNPFK
jgi:hypothetical protein